MEQLNRIDTAGEGISKQEDRFEKLYIMQYRKKNETMKKRLRDMESAVKSSNICLIRYFESDYRNNGRGIIQRDSS